MHRALEIRESLRAKRVGIVVYADGRVVVTKPKRVSVREAERFLESKREWIEKTLEKFARRKARRGGVERVPLPTLRRGTKAYKEAVKSARRLAAERLAFLNKAYGHKIGRISIRNQKSRWGSASRNGNLNFTYRILYLPPTLRDYVIVHELAHLGAFNHSKAFWDLVARTVPDHMELRKELRTRHAL